MDPKEKVHKTITNTDSTITDNASEDSFDKEPEQQLDFVNPTEQSQHNDITSPHSDSASESLGSIITTTPDELTHHEDSIITDNASEDTFETEPEKQTQNNEITPPNPGNEFDSIPTTTITEITDSVVVPNNSTTINYLNPHSTPTQNPVTNTEETTKPKKKKPNKNKNKNKKKSSSNGATSLENLDDILNEPVKDNISMPKQEVQPKKEIKSRCYSTLSEEEKLDFTVLRESCESIRIKEIENILHKSPDLINVFHHKTKDNLLSYTLMSNNPNPNQVLQVINILINKGINLQHITQRGGNSLHYACDYQDPHIVEIILDSSPELLYKRDKEDITPFQIITQKVLTKTTPHNLETFKLIIELQPEAVNIQSKEKVDALHLACICKDLEIVNILVEANANIHSKTINNQTLLHSLSVGSTQKNLPEILEILDLLIKRGIKVETIDSLHMTAFKLFEQKQLFTAAKIILDAGGAGDHIDDRIDENITRNQRTKKENIGDNKEYSEFLESMYNALKDSRIQNGDKLKQLIQHCIDGNISGVKSILNKHPNFVNIQIEKLDSPIFHAMESNRSTRAAKLAIVELFIKKGLKADLRDIHSDNLLHRGCKTGNVDIIRKIIEKMPELMGEESILNTTPLSLMTSGAIQTRHSNKIIKLLLEEGKKHPNINQDITKALYFACEQNERELLDREMAVQDILNLSKIDNEDILPCIERSLLAGNVTHCRSLIEYNPDIINRINDLEQPLIGLASEAHTNNAQIVQLLLEKGLAVPIGEQQNTPILHSFVHSEILREQEDVIMDIIPYFANSREEILIKDRFLCTASDYAAFYGHYKILKFLLEKENGVVVEDHSFDNLKNACSSNNLSTLKNIISNDRKLIHYQEASTKYTILHYAVIANNLEIVKYLVEEEADVNCEDTKGLSPFLMSCIKSDFEIAQYLSCLQQTNLVKTIQLGNMPNINALHLLCACDTINIKSVERQVNLANKLINIGLDVNDHILLGSALMFACENFNYPLVTLFLKHNATSCDSDKYTPMSLICSIPENDALYIKHQHSIKEIAKLLIISGQDVSSKIPPLVNTLHHDNLIIKENGAICSNFDLKKFIETIYSYKSQNKLETSIDHYERLTLFSLIQEGKTSSALKMIQQVPSLARVYLCGSMTALNLACQFCDIELVKSLIALGSDINTVNHFEENTLISTITSQYKTEEEKLEIVKLLVEAGVNLEHKNRYQRSALDCTLMFSALKIERFLLQQGTKNHDREWVLSESKESLFLELLQICPENKIQRIKQIMKSNPSFSSVTNSITGETILHQACINGNVEIVTLLIEKYKADPFLKMKNGSTPFLLACHRGNFAVANYLIDSDNVDLLETAAGLNALQILAMNINFHNQEQLELAQKIIHKHPKLLNGQTLDTPPALNIACCGGNLGLSQTLITNGANINISTIEGETPLIATLSSTTSFKSACSSKIVELLIVLGANRTHFKDINNNSFLDMTLQQAQDPTTVSQIEKIREQDNKVITIQEGEQWETHKNITQLIANQEFDKVSTILSDWKPNLKSAYYASIILAQICAIDNDSMTSDCIKLVEQIINLGVDINFIDEKTNSLLGTACENNNVEMVRILLNEGAFVNLRNCTKGDTPIHQIVASNDEIDNNKKEIITLLLQNGVDFSVPNHANNTALSKENARNIGATKFILEEYHRLLEQKVTPGEDLPDTLKRKMTDLLNIIFDQTQPNSSKIKSAIDIAKVSPEIIIVRNEEGKTLYDIACDLENDELSTCLAELGSPSKEMLKTATTLDQQENNIIKT